MKATIARGRHGRFDLFISDSGEPVARRQFPSYAEAESCAKSEYGATIEPAQIGRPPEMEGGRRRNVYLDDASWQRAQELGAGNASDGIRIALQRAEPTSGTSRPC